MQERRVAVEPGVSLHVADHPGDRPAFLLVHGLASNLRLWDGVAAELSGRGRRVVAVDLRGHGQSDKPSTGYDVGTVANDLAALIEQLELDRPWVAGQSWGGNVALELAWGRPELVSGIACVDGGWIELQDRFADWVTCRHELEPPRTTGMSLAALEQRVRTAHPDWPEAGIEGVVAGFEQRDGGTVAPLLTLERHLEVLRGLWQHRPSSRYVEVKVPVLLLPARRPGVDDLEVRTAVEKAEHCLPASRTVWIEGDHDLHAQHPDRVAAALLSAAEELR